jgi:hypothetical protein
MRQSYEVAVTNEVTFKTVSIPSDVNSDFVSCIQLDGVKGLFYGRHIAGDF